LLRNRNGGDAGTFVTAVPDWTVGEVYMRSPGDYFRILAIDDPPDDQAHGVWTIEPGGKGMRPAFPRPADRAAPSWE
jgi:hypothetical protein